MSLPEALERAANRLPKAADAIRDANGDPNNLLATLGGESATELASWLLEHEVAAGAEIAGEWSQSDEGVRVIAAIDEKALPKAGRKALRRVLHSLRTAGVALPEAPPAAPKISRLPEIEESLQAAYLLPLDPRGARIVFLIEPNPSGGARLVEAAVDDVRGIVDFGVYSAGRSRVRAFTRELEKRGGGAAVFVEPAAAKALLARIAQAHPESRPLPKSFSDQRKRLGIVDPLADTPGDLVQRALGPVEADSPALARVEALIESGELGPWPPALERLREVGEAFKEKAEGTLIVSGATQRDRVETALTGAADELFDDEFSNVTATRFRETAYFFWKVEREDDARSALAAAAAFGEGPASENPVARALVRSLLAPLVKEVGGGNDQSQGEEPSLLVKP
jgi:hypothetical protein